MAERSAWRSRADRQADREAEDQLPDDFPARLCRQEQPVMCRVDLKDLLEVHQRGILEAEKGAHGAREASNDHEVPPAFPQRAVEQ